MYGIKGLMAGEGGYFKLFWLKNGLKTVHIVNFTKYKKSLAGNRYLAYF